MHLFTIFIALHKSYCVGGVQVQQQPKHYLIVYIYICAGGIQVQQQPEQPWRNLEMGDS